MKLQAFMHTVHVRFYYWRAEEWPFISTAFQMGLIALTMTVLTFVWRKTFFPLPWPVGCMTANAIQSVTCAWLTAKHSFLKIFRVIKPFNVLPKLVLGQVLLQCSIKLCNTYLMLLLIELSQGFNCFFVVPKKEVTHPP